MSQNSDHAAAGLVTLLLAVVILSMGSSVIGLMAAKIPARPAVDEYYWGYRSLDILAQAFLVFAASAAVAALFRLERGEEGREEEAKTGGAV
ncbi:MAG: hypothetical protein QW390_02000 [Candidatus Bathyarchaeia archaeon]